MLQADAYGFGEVFDDSGEIEFTLVDAGPDAASAKRLSRRGPLDPLASIAAYAIQADAPIVASNVAQDPRFTDLLVRQFGVVSALVVPLSRGGKPLGVLAAFTKEPREFPRDDACFVETIGHVLAAAIARIKLEAEASRFRLFAEGALETIDSLVLQLDPQGNLLDMNQACRRATGFDAADVRGQPLVNVLAVPQEVETIQGKFRQVKRAEAGSPDAESRFDGQLLTRSGQRRRVAWALTALRDSSGTIVYLLMTGTERAEAAQAASGPLHRRERTEEAPAPIEADAGRADVSGRPEAASPPRQPDAAPPAAGPDATAPSLLPCRRTPTGVAKEPPLQSSPDLPLPAADRPDLRRADSG